MCIYIYYIIMVYIVLLVKYCDDAEPESLLNDGATWPCAKTDRGQIFSSVKHVKLCKISVPTNVYPHLGLSQNEAIPKSSPFHA